MCVPWYGHYHILTMLTKQEYQTFVYNLITSLHILTTTCLPQFNETAKYKLYHSLNIYLTKIPQYCQYFYLLSLYNPTTNAFGLLFVSPRALLPCALTIKSDVAYTCCMKITSNSVYELVREQAKGLLYITRIIARLRISSIRILGYSALVR